MAPPQTDKALSSNTAVTYPIKYFHWAAGLLGSGSSAEKDTYLEGGGRSGFWFLLQGLFP